MNRSIGTSHFHPIGLGCMSLSHGYGTPPDADYSARFLHKALDLGYNHLDTARIYGRGHNETLIGETLKGRRKHFFLASKCGLVLDGPKRGADCRPEAIRAALDESLRLLQTDFIDLYYLHRPDFDVPIEESVGELARLVQAGKIGGIGLSEMSAETLRRAAAVYPIAAMQSEYSLWTRNPEIAVLEACRALGTTFVAFSPVGRGVLANGLRDPAVLAENDIRYPMPRFSAENWPKNLGLIDKFNAIAASEGVTPAQLALGWVLSRGEHIVAIPGTANIAHLEENIARADYRPSDDVTAQLDVLINERTVAGERYGAAMAKTVGTENFVTA